MTTVGPQDRTAVSLVYDFDDRGFGGLTNAMIADHLVVSEATVRTHLSRILMKLGLHDRAQAVSAAFKTGLVRPDDRPLPVLVRTRCRHRAKGRTDTEDSLGIRV
jgi:hypothetical protein